VDFLVDFLDGGQFRVQSEPGSVIKPESLMTIPEKGLPFHKNPYKFGNLFVLFTVKFPDSLEAAQVDQVADTLKAMKKKNEKMVATQEVAKLIPYSADQKNTDARGGARADHEEDEDDEMRGPGGARGQRVQCAQQ